MGVPELIVSLLDDWASKRRTQLRVNGTLSDWYPMLAGTPQGDPLSCLLFNLYIEPLIRYIKSNVAIRGVSIPGGDRFLKDFFFADDINGLSGLHPDHSQATMDAVMLWCRDWGCKVGTGKGKTETVTFLAGTATVADAAVVPVLAIPPPPLDIDSAQNVAAYPKIAPCRVTTAALAHAVRTGIPVDTAPPVLPPVTITESEGYAFLGYRASHDLEDRLATSGLIRKINWNYLRLFEYNLTIRRCSPTLQLQLLHTSVLGPIDYLVSILNIDSKTEAKIDTLQLKFGRKIFGLSRNTPNSVVTAISVINPFQASVCRDRQRLLTQTADPLYPETSLASDVLKGMYTEGPARRNALANLAVRWATERAKINTHKGVDLAPPDLPPHRVAVEMALFGDRVGRQIWLHDAKVQSGLQDTRSNPRQPRGGALLASPPSLYVPRPTAQNHAADIYFNFTQPLNIEVEVHGRPPMSLHGPSGTSILALCNLPCAAVSIVARLQAGDLALQRFPWRPRSTARPTDVTPESLRGTTGNGIAGDDNELSDSDDSSSDSDNDTVQNCNESLTDSDPDEPLGQTDSDRGSTDDSDSQAQAPSGPAAPTSGSQANTFTGRSLDRIKFMSLERSCRLCSNSLEQPYHFFFECTAGGFPSLRSALVADAPAQFGRIVSGISTALLNEYEEDADGADDAAKAALLEVFAGGDTKESHWLTHRLLWAVTWAARDVPTNAVAAHALGRLFDSTVLSRHALRPVADSWIGWSTKWTRRFGNEWARQLKLKLNEDTSSSVAAPEATLPVLPGPQGPPILAASPELR
jgi:hypothetical protein